MKGLRSRRGQRDIAPPATRRDDGTARPGDVILYTPWGEFAEREKPTEHEARAEGARAAVEILRRQREGEAGE